MAGCVYIFLVDGFQYTKAGALLLLKFLPVDKTVILFVKKTNKIWLTSNIPENYPKIWFVPQDALFWDHRLHLLAPILLATTTNFEEVSEALGGLASMQRKNVAILPMTPETTYWLVWMGIVDPGTYICYEVAGPQRQVHWRMIGDIKKD